LFASLARTWDSRLVQYSFIAAGLVAITANTVADRPSAQITALQVVLWICLLFFIIEWAASAVSAFRSGRPYWTTPSWLIDALAVVPIPLALVIGVPPATAWLFGALWLLKLAVVSPGLARLGRVVSLEAEPLLSVLVIFIMVLFVAAVMLHLLERQEQPASFGSLPASLWWAVVTLTTTGYGDAVPASQLGRLVAGLVMICGLGVFGLLTGILATGFVEDSRRHSFVQNWNLIQSVPFFRCLDPAGVIELSRMLRRWDVAEGTSVIRRGQEGDCMYFVASGEVEVQLDPQPVRLGPGAFFGELALMGSGIRNATVQTTLPTTLLILDVAEFRTFTAHQPALAQAVEAEAQRRTGKKADPSEARSGTSATTAAISN
jgi:voltage-gated potassium channel